MMKICVAAHDKETGGILIGRYNQDHDCALISAVTPPPKDSRHESARFIRGTYGLQKN